MNRNGLHATLTILLLAFFTTVSFGQDFQQSYSIAEGSRISIKNVAGNISVKGYDGAAIVATAFREGIDRDRSKIVDASTADKVDISVDYPQDCNCDSRIRFEILIPRHTNYNYDAFSSGSGHIAIEEIIGVLQADSLSGNVSVNNFVGAVTASSFSGNVSITQALNVAYSVRQVDRRETIFMQARGRRGVQRANTTAQSRGAVIAKSISGNVLIDLLRLDNLNASQLDFNSMSGNVDVRLPRSLSATVAMSTVVGVLTTEFPLTIDPNILVPGQSAYGLLGDGTHRLKISTIVGNVALRKND